MWVREVCVCERFYVNAEEVQEKMGWRCGRPTNEIGMKGVVHDKAM